ncbi:MBL fold metallo-hydrolase [Brevibacterium jeotgali]|nr:MBL fold metallo-hydrolase [Brevibacterium jeotgali]
MSATVHVLVTDPVRLNSVLITGADRALLIDTGAGPEQATRILAAVRGLTDLPLTVANTHDHWDHFFGNPTFAEAGVTEFLGSPAFVRDSPGSAWLQHAEASEHVLELPAPDALLVTTRAVADGEILDLGALRPDGAHGGESSPRGSAPHRVELLSLSGHTDTDLAVRVGPIVVCGDLVEEGAPPQVGLDATPLAWVRSLDALLALRDVERFVPGHGSPVTRAFVETQRDDLLRAAEADDASGLPARRSGRHVGMNDSAPSTRIDPPSGVHITRLL